MGPLDEAARVIHVPPGGPPRIERPDPSIYRIMGEAAIFAMLADLYRELESSSIRHLFAEDMPAASERSAAFFVGLLGGPPRYQERFGPPMMRRRHMPFRIDAQARRAWLDCFDRVLERAPQEYGFPAEHLPGFRSFLDSFSAWMVNTKD